MDLRRLTPKLKVLAKYKYLILVVLAGIVLLLLPTGAEKEKSTRSAALSTITYSLEAEEKRLEKALECIEGAGKVQVLLSLKGGVERELAVSDSEALVVSSGSGKQEAVELRYIYPEYLGAVVICEGAGDSGVKLDVTKAVSSATGLSSDKITVVRMDTYS